ncbi:MAG: trypsin-like serine protease [Planctomycetota bacterium]
MKKWIFGLGLLVTALVGTALAVQYGQPDNNDHPYVGMVVFYDKDDNPLGRCSGTLVSPTVFLTAAHCTAAPAAKAAIWFDPEPAQLFAKEYPWKNFPVQPAILPTKADAMGTPIAHPSFTGLTVPQTSDVGVVVLDKPVTMAKYGVIADVGTLDKLATRRGRQDTTFKVVAYGLQSVKPTLSAVPQRRRGTVSLINLKSALTDGWNLHYTNNPGKGNGEGGLSFGDSGGPVFLGDTNIIVAVNSFVMNANSKGAGFGYRVDTAYAQAFLDDFVDLD